MEQEIVIKPYEPIDDQALTKLCIENMFHTQRLTRKALIQWTIAGLGWFKVILRLSIAQIALSIVFQMIGLKLLTATIVSLVTLALILTILYGFVFYNKFVENGRYYANSTVAKDFSDIKGNFMGENKCFWIATQKVSTPTPKERIVGCVLVEPYNWERDEMGLASRRKELGEVAELRRMSVAQDIRGKGIGMKLGLELKKFCKEKGYKYVMLSTLANNHSAIGLYKKLGFELKKTMCHFYGVIPFNVAYMIVKL